MVALTAVIIWGSMGAHAQAGLPPAKIELSLSSHRVVRGDLIIVSGRLSSVSDNRPIPLVTVRLQYYRYGEPGFIREVTTITTNPGALFEDRLNTTYLLRIGTWVINASFPSQLGYESTSTTETFNVVVQPALSLYLSNHRLTLGESVNVNGFLFACIPCVDDEITVIFARSDNTSISLPLKLAPTGGPYPGGFYNVTFRPDVPGLWHVRAIWKGNDVSLPAYSLVEEMNVEGAGTGVEGRVVLYVVIVVVATAVSLFGLLWRKRQLLSRDSK